MHPLAMLRWSRAGFLLFALLALVAPAQAAEPNRLIRPSTAAAPPDDPSAEADSLLDRGRALEDDGSFDAAREHYRDAAERLRETPDSARLARALVHLGRLQRWTGRFDEALASYTEAEPIAEALDDAGGVARVNYELGLLHWSLGRLEEALPRYQRALAIWQPLGEKQQVARCLNNIGIIYYHWAAYQLALDFYRQSLELRHEIGDTRGTALVLNNIGKTYQEWGHVDRALQAYEEAYAYVEADTSDALAYALYNQASAYMARGDYARARTLILAAEDVYRHTHSLGGLVETLIGKARLHIELGDFDRATRILNQALDEARSDDLFILKATALQELGSLHAQRGDRPLALRRLHESLEITQRLQTHNLTLENYRLLSESYEALGDQASALRYHRLYSSKTDSLFGQRKAHLLAQLEARYEAERREREIASLRHARDRQHMITWIVGLSLAFALLLVVALLRANVQKRRSNRQLLASNRQVRIERDEQRALVQMLCHDLANPLATVQGCLDLMLEAPETTAEFGEMARRVTRQGIDITNLVREMQIADRDRLPLEVVDLQRALTDATLVLHSQLEGKRIALEVDVEPGLQVVAEHRSLASSVLANLLSNAIKFSPPDSRIRVKAATDGDATLLTLRDYGIGIPAATRAVLFEPGKATSRPGTNGEHGSGFGMLLVKKFVSLYGAEIEVHSREPHEAPEEHGTEIRLRFQTAAVLEAVMAS